MNNSNIMKMLENSTIMRAILTLVFGWAVSPGSAAIQYRNLAGIGVECGTSGDQSFQSRQGRIMGGSAATIIDYPYTVSFQKAESGKHFCAGSLVHKDYVITAAHCLYECGGRHHYNCDLRKYDAITLVAGEQDTAAADGTEQKLYIDHVTIHPEYDWKTKKVDTKYDIAVIKLKTSVEWTNYVRPICLPGSRETLDEGTRSHIAGWGLDYDHDNTEWTPVEDMQNVTINIVENKDCETKLGQGIDLSDNLRFCAGLEEGGHDACQGDSGSGLITIRSGRQILSGVMSFGKRCGLPMLPGVYTRVMKFGDWIKNIVSGV